MGKVNNLIAQKMFNRITLEEKVIIAGENIIGATTKTIDIGAVRWFLFVPILR